MSEPKRPVQMSQEEIEEFEKLFNCPGAGERALAAGVWVLVEA